MSTDIELDKILNTEHVRLTSMTHRLVKGTKGTKILQTGYTISELRDYLQPILQKNSLTFEDYPKKWTLSHNISVRALLKRGYNAPEIFHALTNLQIKIMGVKRIKYLKVPTRKLSAENEQAILDLLLIPDSSNSRMSQQAIAKLFTEKLGYNVSRSLISQIAIKNKVNTNIKNS